MSIVYFMLGVTAGMIIMMIVTCLVIKKELNKNDHEGMD